MGIGGSRRSTRTAQTTAGSGNSYKYPPKTENYFSSHFIMGGERFESAKPDAYLFGENEDLNFLGSRPIPFPYPVPQPHEPTKTLRSLINIRRDSVRFVKDVDETNNSLTGDATRPRYNIEFTFDTDVKCAITIHYFAKEELINKQATYHPRNPDMSSETFHYKRGANQTFNQPTHLLDPSQFGEDEWKYNRDSDVIPIVIQCVVEEPEHEGHCHVTFAVVEKAPDGGFSLKPLKQKQVVDGLCYLLQEVYGIENKNSQRVRQQQQQEDDDVEDNGSECVICMCETRDTLILPCRHLCLCNSCADNLRYQANNCPICRAKFHALLQIKAMQKRTNNAATEVADENSLNQTGVPPGYEAVSLIEALNGPTQAYCACSVPTVPTDANAQSLSNAADNAPASEAGLQKEDGDAKTAVKGDDLPPETTLDEPVCGEVDKKQNIEEGCSENTRQSSVSCKFSEAENERLDTSIPISDDEDSEDPNMSAYATPLHQSRVVLRSPGPSLAETEPPENGSSDQTGPPQVTDEGRSHTNAGCFDDSRYSSSSSTRDLLEQSPEEAADETAIRGIAGCAEAINISII